MKIIVRYLVVVVSLLLVQQNLVTGAESATTEGGRLRKEGRLFVLELFGSPHERGLQHGRALRREIAEVLALWRADLARSSKSDAEAVIKEFLTATNFVPAIEKWTPGLLDEVRGLAEGSGQSFETILAFQLLDEMWVYLDQRDAHRCSSLGVARRGDRAAYVAQNMDLESFRDGFQVVLRLAETKEAPEQLIFTCAGLVALNGLNRHRIGLAVNTLMELTASSTGLPVAFVIRGVLAQRTGATALEFLRRVPHASGQNYVLGVGDEVFDLEASAGKVVPLPLSAGGFVAHTNHAIVNDDLKPWHRARLVGMTPQQRAESNSGTRLKAVEARLTQAGAGIDAGVIKATLQSKDSARFPVCVPVRPNRGATFGGVVMTLAEEPVLEVSAGPPDMHPFVRLAFSPAGR